jgi:spore coat polysaccharide biosynthesis protein SpsF (cytidylyltransferase family)
VRKILAITQARTGSTRFPNKIMKKIKDKTLLKIHVDRIKKSKRINSVIIATTNKQNDDLIENEAFKLKVNCFRGSEDDVLDRFYQAAKNYEPDYIVRLTSDCPLIDPNLIDEIIDQTIKTNADYCSNTLIESYPDGQDVEVFTFKFLKKTWEESILKSDREHVTPFMKNNKIQFNLVNFHSKNLEYEKVRMTIDEPEDFEVITFLINKLGFDESWQNYAKLYLNDKNISRLNNSIIRNEGYLKSIENDL